jgi:threonine dehydrogenase-like Zn-dependent dehydrogenase
LSALPATQEGRAAAVTGAGFITLAATLSSIAAFPVAGLALVFGVDRFTSETRAVTNLIGNCVATLVVARWDGALNLKRTNKILDGEILDVDMRKPTEKPASGAEVHCEDSSNHSLVDRIAPHLGPGAGRG